jgi:predicted peptidase
MMRARLRFPIFFVLAVLFTAASAAAKKQETGFLDRAVVVQGTSYKYQVYVPENWSPKQKWPVILFLHGAGERADDGMFQTQVGIGRAIREHRERFPAIVVLPQCRKDDWWAKSPMDDQAIAALEAATKEFHGDKDRTYLTGLSMGGYGTWHLAAKYPGRFAAITPICGGVLMPDAARVQQASDSSPYTEAAKKIGGKTPTWIFHGGDDPVVPVTESQRMNEAMKAMGGDVRYTEYPGVGHDSWTKAYDEAELMKWMLSKSLSGNAAAK